MADKRNDDGHTFEEWMRLVDNEVVSISGLSVHDLADQPFWDMWNDGCPPSEAAHETLEEEGFPFE